MFSSYIFCTKVFLIFMFYKENWKLFIWYSTKNQNFAFQRCELRPLNEELGMSRISGTDFLSEGGGANGVTAPLSWFLWPMPLHMICVHMYDCAGLSGTEQRIEVSGPTLVPTLRLVTWAFWHFSPIYLNWVFRVHSCYGTYVSWLLRNRCARVEWYGKLIC